MTKINVSTHLNKVFTTSVRTTLGADPTLVDSRKWLGPARSAVEEETFRLLTMYGSR
jgi:fructose/tagatose bisphosphate aldolase